MRFYTVIKNNFIPLLFLLFAVFLLLFSSSTFNAAKVGLSLWANSVIPSLFPFLVAVELLNHTNLVYYLSILLDKYMRPFFNLPGISAFPFLMGLLSGYPVGAKIVGDMYASGLCTKAEAERMLCFTNNSGPLFIIGTVGISFYSSSTIGIILLITHILASISIGIISGFLSRTKALSYKSKFSKKIISSHNNGIKKVKDISILDLGEILGTSIMNSIKTVLLIGGFVTLFSVISTILEKTKLISVLATTFSLCFHIDSSIVSAFITGIFEFTNGLSKLSLIHLKNISTNIVLSAFIIGFGGISVTLQVLSIISKQHLSIRKYVLGKVFQAVLAMIYTYLIIQIPFFNLDL